MITATMPHETITQLQQQILQLQNDATAINEQLQRSQAEFSSLPNPALIDCQQSLLSQKSDLNAKITTLQNQLSELQSQQIEAQQEALAEAELTEDAKVKREKKTIQQRIRRNKDKISELRTSADKMADRINDLTTELKELYPQWKTIALELNSLHRAIALEENGLADNAWSLETGEFPQLYCKLHPRPQPINLPKISPNPERLVIADGQQITHWKPACEQEFFRIPG